MVNWLYPGRSRFRRDYYFDELSAEFTSDNKRLERDLLTMTESIVLRLDVVVPNR